MDYKHLLVATDFSDIGEQACIKAAKLAKLLNAKLTLIHIIEHFPVDRPENCQVPAENTDPKTFFVQQAKQELEATAERLGLQNVACDVVLSASSAGREIARYADEKSVDLIVVGTHGEHGLLQRLGSTANSIMHDASTDVLVVRAKEK